MRGIISAGGYLPYRRLDRASISEFLGSGGGRGQRTVASYDEDTTTMGVEAGSRGPGQRPRRARARGAVVRHRRPPRTSTRPTPPPSTPRCGSRADIALDFNGAARSAVGALEDRARRQRLRHARRRPTCASVSPAAPTKRTGGDGAAALDHRQRLRRPRDRRVPRRCVGHRGVHRALARAGRRRIGSLGGAVRRDPVRAARRERVEARPRRRRRRPGAGGQADRRAACTPVRCATSLRASAWRRKRWSTTAPPPSATPAPRRPRSSSPTRSSRRLRARSSRSCRSPTAPTCSCSAPPTPSRRGTPCARSPSRTSGVRRSATARCSPGAARSPSRARAGRRPAGSRPR